MTCERNGKNVRKNLGKKCSPQELDSMRLIRNKIHCAGAALSPANIAADCGEEKAELFVKAAVSAKAEALFLEDDWWRKAVVKYGLPPGVFLDFQEGDFFILTPEV